MAVNGLGHMKNMPNGNLDIIKISRAYFKDSEGMYRAMEAYKSFQGLMHSAQELENDCKDTYLGCGGIWKSVRTLTKAKVVYKRPVGKAQKGYERFAKSGTWKARVYRVTIY